MSILNIIILSLIAMWLVYCVVLGWFNVGGKG